MALKLIKKSIDINAPKEKVWEVLLKNEYIEKWYKAFGEGIIADTNWQLGSKAVFKDSKGSGLIGKIAERKDNEIISIEYSGMLINGKEDFESAEAKNMKGGHETYKLSEKDGVTHLDTEFNMDEKDFQMMSDLWEKALRIIKDLAEK